ncbi:MAG: stage V sporulation protein AC [Ruminococcus sp.]|nr:stage V sporulation protein AC [Ruminococcus sp.]MCD7801123.1 stage V sporulation protein AC [Ruminococcus sp.]
MATITPQEYSRMSDNASPKSNVVLDTLKAFLIGGAICLIGQIILNIYQGMGLDKEASSSWTSITLVLISAILTGFGIYEKVAKHGGAGTLVPITGFANAVVSCAIENRSEGLVLGVGAKIFTIAGPVILYGTVASVIYGIVYWFMSS